MSDTNSDQEVFNSTYGSINSSKKDIRIQNTNIPCSQTSQDLFKRLNFDKFIKNSLKKLDKCKNTDINRVRNGIKTL